MARQSRVPSVVACYLLIAIMHLCSCYANYVEYMLENEKICNLMDKQHTHYLRNATAAIVASHHMFDRWNVNTDRKCQYNFRTTNGDGLFVVIQKMFFRRNGSECLDYVRFKRTDGYYTEKICGQIDRDEKKYFPTSLKDISQTISNKEVTLFLHDAYDIYAEFDIGKPQTGVDMKTEIFISKEKVPDGQTLNLNMVYTPYKDCNKVNIIKYASVGRNSCIRLDYYCDKMYNCPYRICSDEDDCMYSEELPKDDTATKVTVGAVTTMILCFIIFVMCLWICKKSQKLCWSSDCAGPNACSRPNSLPQDTDGGAGSNRAVPTAPMLEVAMSSPVADKDLPPSYDSLFPEQENPATS
ncbi:hypothetical protein HN011_002801 [Eciton burchellii]|nr:hypothetical protein HN011_002801 [Eciton burchellii]